MTRLFRFVTSFHVRCNPCLCAQFRGIDGLGDGAGGQGGLGPGGTGEGMDQERRIRREIANSNERRRMQSINAGFQSLRTLLPHHEGEKLSKVGPYTPS